MKVMILTDSRGLHLQEKIVQEIKKQLPQHTDELHVTVRIMEGATPDNILKKMNSKYGALPYCDLIYVNAGVNNLSIKRGPVVNPVYDNVADLIDDVTDKITTLKSKINSVCKNVVIAQVVGIDIARYNREVDDGFWYYQQNVINDAMPLLAHTINFVNRADNLVGPWLTSTVHDFVNRKLYNRYGKLRDGLHPNDQTQEKWAGLFVRSIYTNYVKLYVN